MKFLQTIFVFIVATTAIFFVFGLVNGNVAFGAGISVTSSSLNGKGQNAIFNPNTSEVSIEAIADVPVKFTRLYICATTQTCNGTKGNYTRYFTSSEVSKSINKVWNGRVSSDSKSDFALAGEYKVMVSMVEGSNSAVTEFLPYTITVSFSDVGDVTLPPDDGNSDEDNEDEGQDGNGGSDGGDDSAHYEQTSLSNYTESASVFKVSAGRERVSYVGSPIIFEAKAKIPSSVNKKSADYTWSFGDGASGRGEKVIHFYKYPGQYNIVLNAEFEDETSVSRTVAQVFPPDLIISEISDGSVEIKNNGKQEINLYDWSLVSGTQKYIFPLDTIISAGQKNIFPLDYTKFVITENPWLMDATNKGVVPISVNLNRASVQNNNKEISLADFEQLIQGLKSKQIEVTPVAVAPVSQLITPSEQLVALTDSSKILQATNTKEEYWSDLYEKNTKEALAVNSPGKDVEIVEDTSTARSDLAVPEVSPPGFWSKVFHPVRTIKGAFYK